MKEMKHWCETCDEETPHEVKELGAMDEVMLMNGDTVYELACNKCGCQTEII